MSYRLDNATGSTLLSGRDIPAAVTGLERALAAGLASAARESEELRRDLERANAENIRLSAEAAALRRDIVAVSMWATTLTQRG